MNLKYLKEHLQSRQDIKREFKFECEYQQDFENHNINMGRKNTRNKGQEKYIERVKHMINEVPKENSE